MTAPIADHDIPPCGCAEPGAADPWTCYCGVEDLLRVIRRRYSLSVMNAVRAHGRARFHEIERAVPAASTSTLAETLRALTAVGLVAREEAEDAVPRTSYALTGSGEKLLSRLRRLLEDVR